MKTKSYKEPDVEFKENSTTGRVWKLYFEEMEIHWVEEGWFKAKIRKGKLHTTDDGKLAYTQQGRADIPGTQWTLTFSEDVQVKWLEWCRVLATKLVEDMCDKET